MIREDELKPEVAKVAREGADSAIVTRAVAFLREGRLLIYPTDTLYALGGMALDPDVVRRVIQAKRRPVAKPLPLIAVDAAQARALCETWPQAARILSLHFWPGPLTLVLPGRSGLPQGVLGRHGAVAVRVPALDLARRLCRGAGPLVSTSANQSGDSPPTSFKAAWRAVGAHVALALDAGPTSSNPSTIVDTTLEPPRLVREGAISWESIGAVLTNRRRLLE